MRRYHVECVCTTDDPVDDLRYHKQTRESGFEIKMIPAWRPDKAMNIEKPEFPAYVAQLADVSGVSIVKFADMVDALQKRHDFFSENGCKLSDHGIEEFLTKQELVVLEKKVKLVQEEDVEEKKNQKQNM